jgi:DNA-binding LacI/PurR family transcriptional regulator
MNTHVHPNLPKYAQLAERLRSEIAAGVLKPGSRLPSYTQVQERYGASKQTLERAHSLLEQEGLILRRNGIGTFVADPARRATTGVIAMAQNFPSRHPYYLRLLQGVQEAAHDRQFEVLLLHPESRVSWEKIDGLLGCAGESDEFLLRLPPGMPYMGLLHPVGDEPQVIADDFNGMREAVRYLVGLGHRRIGYLAGSAGSLQGIARRRMEGYRTGLREDGIAFQEEWRRPFYNEGPQKESKAEQGREKMGQWLEDGWKKTGCTAIVAQNDEAAMGAIDALQDAGYHVPRDVSVVGFDGLDLVHPACGPLTTVQVPLYEIGAQGAASLIDVIERPLSAGAEEQAATPIVLPPVLRPGGSTAPAPHR